MNNLGVVMRKEFAHSINGVAGRMLDCIGGALPGTFSSQQWKASREYTRQGTKERITVTVRYDDQCKNGHNTLSIVGDIYVYDSKRGAWRDYSGGQIVEDIRRRFPELAPLLPFHLCSSDGPMGYVANTVYHAGDRDYNGLRKGERRQIRNGRTGQLSWILTTETAPTYLDADTCPPAPEPRRYVPWERIGEGKERDLDAARECAIWPDATDAQLMVEPAELRAALDARLPKLLADFRALVTGAGFLWSPEERT